MQNKKTLKLKARIVIANDIHTNSTWGLSPPNMILSNGTIPDTPLRRFLWDSWKKFSDLANKKPISLIIYNGDLADGFCDKTAGIGTWSPDKNDWIDSFKRVHEVLTRNKDIPTVVTMGTGYHLGTQRGLDMDKEIAYAIGATYKRTYVCEMEGYLFDISHQAGGISLINPESMLQREIKQMEHAVRLHKIVPPDAIIRAHVHTYKRLDDAGITTVINGCWCGITDYLARKSNFVIPDIGGIIIDIYDGIRPIINYIGFRYPRELAQELSDEEIDHIFERIEKAEKEKVTEICLLKR